MMTSETKSEAGADIRTRVVLFTDVHHYSIASRSFQGREHLFLQEMYQTLGEIVVTNGGEIIKYLGDGLLCAFPTDRVESAVACGIRMRASFADMVEAWGLQGETELEVGLDLGPVVEGVFGHRTLKQKDIFGEVVNRAAMIGHHRGIAVTEPVREAVQDLYTLRRLADMTVKWQTEPLKLWEVVV